MKEDFIKRFDNTIIGILRYENNGDITALEFPSRRIVGMYIKAQDHTIEFPSRRILTSGNSLMMLLGK